MNKFFFGEKKCKQKKNDSPVSRILGSQEKFASKKVPCVRDTGESPLYGVLDTWELFFFCLHFFLEIPNFIISSDLLSIVPDTGESF